MRVGRGGAHREGWVRGLRPLRLGRAHALIPLWQGGLSLKASSRLPCHGGVGGWSAILNPEKVLVLKDVNPLKDKCPHLHKWGGAFDQTPPHQWLWIQLVQVVPNGF